MKKNIIKNIIIYLIKLIILFIVLLFFTVVINFAGGLFGGGSIEWWEESYVLIPTYLIILFLISNIYRIKLKKENFFSKYLFNPLLIIIGLIICFEMLNISMNNRKKKDENENKILSEYWRYEEAISNADEIIAYNYWTYPANTNTLDTSSIDLDTILIDYDEKKVSFVLGKNTTITFELREGKAGNNLIEQSIFELKEKGNYITTFYGYGDENLTIEIQLTLQDGTTYIIDRVDANEKKSDYYNLNLGFNTNRIKNIPQDYKICLSLDPENRTIKNYLYIYESYYIISHEQVEKNGNIVEYRKTTDKNILKNVIDFIKENESQTEESGKKNFLLKYNNENKDINYYVDENVINKIFKTIDYRHHPSY